MMDPWHPRTLTDAEFVRHMHRENARLDAMTHEIERRERVEEPPPAEDFRAFTAWEASRDLAALGVPRPYLSWACGVVYSRLWLLEILSLADDFQRYRLVLWTAENVRDGRLRRRFGSAAITAADVEEARAALGYGNERWKEIRERAVWVLRDLDPHQMEPE